ncbi:hypothetical protein V2J09_011038 [Rumex salicifolius]
MTLEESRYEIFYQERFHFQSLNLSFALHLTPLVLTLPLSLSLEPVAAALIPVHETLTAIFFDLDLPTVNLAFVSIRISKFKVFSRLTALLSAEIWLLLTVRPLLVTVVARCVVFLVGWTNEGSFPAAIWAEEAEGERTETANGSEGEVGGEDGGGGVIEGADVESGEGEGRAVGAVHGVEGGGGDGGEEEEDDEEEGEAASAAGPGRRGGALGAVEHWAGAVAVLRRLGDRGSRLGSIEGEGGGGGRGLGLGCPCGLEFVRAHGCRLLLAVS